MCRLLTLPSSTVLYGWPSSEDLAGPIRDSIWQRSSRQLRPEIHRASGWLDPGCESMKRLRKPSVERVTGASSSTCLVRSACFADQAIAELAIIDDNHVLGAQMFHMCAPTSGVIADSGRVMTSM